MGARFTVRLDDDLAEWVESEADDRERSKAGVVSEALRAAKGVESTYSQHDGARRTAPKASDCLESGAESTEQYCTDAESTEKMRGGTDPTANADLRERVEDLEECVAELEARESARDELAEDRYTVADPGGETATDAGDDVIPEHGVEALIGNDVDPEVNEAVARAAEWWPDDTRLPDCVAAAVAVLEAAKESEYGLSKTEIIDGFYNEYGVDGQSERTWWRRNISEGAEDDAAPAPLRLVADYSRGTHKWTWRGLDEDDAGDLVR